MQFVITFRNRDKVRSRPEALAAWAAQSEYGPFPGTVGLYLFANGNGGFAVVESDDPLEIYKMSAFFRPWLDCEIELLVDIEEAATAEVSMLSS